MKDATELPGPLGKRTRLRWGWRRSFQPVSATLSALLPRGFDILLALILLALLWPVLIVRAVIARWQAGRVLDLAERIGRLRNPFRQYVFAGHAAGKSLPVLFNILSGDMAFAGPRALSPEEAAALPPEASIRFCVRPGLFSPHGIRHKTGIAYDDEMALDREFYYDETARGNAGLIVRAALGGLLAGRGERATPDRFTLFGVPIVNTTLNEAIDGIIRRAHGNSTKLLAFVNPDCLNIAYTHSDYHAVLNRADEVWPDGIGIQVGCRILGLSLRENVNGTDMFPRLCKRAAQEGLSLYLLGAKPGIAQLAAENMQIRFPELKIAGTRDGYFPPEEEPAVIEAINQSGAAILLVAFGAPRQELWLARHQTALRPRVLIGVGGLFDFYSGRIPRAPVWMREIGLEWTWRLLQEPGRMWRRYIIGNPVFLYRVYRQKLKEPPA